MIPEVVVLGSLLWASWQDVTRFHVSDVVWIVGGCASLLASMFLSGPSALLGVTVQAVLMAAAGKFFQVYSSPPEEYRGETGFGDADILGLALIGTGFPQASFFQLLAAVMVPAYVYMVVESRRRGSKKVPFMPGLLLGAFTAVLVL